MQGVSPAQNLTWLWLEKPWTEEIIERKRGIDGRKESHRNRKTEKIDVQTKTETGKQHRERVRERERERERDRDRDRD